MTASTRRTILNYFFHRLADMADRTPHLVEARGKCRVIKNVSYFPDDDIAHLLDIYQPKKVTGSLPVMIYIHGGGFTLCSKETHRGCALMYSRNGFLVFMLNYRLAPRHPYPAAFEDVCRAFCWVVEHAASYGGDPGRIVIAGESAGGNLALALTVATCYERPEPTARMVWNTTVTPAALQCVAGFLQVSEPHRFSLLLRHKPNLGLKTAMRIIHDLNAAYLGRKRLTGVNGPALSDPLLVIETAGKPQRVFPPVFTAVGTADILRTDTERLEAALKAKGVSVETYYYPGEPHVFHFMFWRKNARRFWRDAFAFLDTHFLSHENH